MIAVAIGGVPALLAAVLSVIGLGLALDTDRRVARLFYLGAAMVLVLAIEIVVYGRYLAVGGVPPLILPLLERPATLLLLAWLVAIALSMKRLSSSFHR
jgi:hypothetical protein